MSSSPCSVEPSSRWTDGAAVTMVSCTVLYGCRAAMRWSSALLFCHVQNLLFCATAVQLIPQVLDSIRLKTDLCLNQAGICGVSIRTASPFSANVGHHSCPKGRGKGIGGSDGTRTRGLLRDRQAF